MTRAMGTAVEMPVDLDTVTDDLAVAVLAGRGHAMNGAFEAVEDMAGASRDHLEALVIVVPTYLARCHRRPFPGTRFACVPVQRGSTTRSGVAASGAARPTRRPFPRPCSLLGAGRDASPG